MANGTSSAVPQRAAKAQPGPGARAGTTATPLPYLEATNSRINFKRGAEKLPFSLVETDLSFWQESRDWRIRSCAFSAAGAHGRFAGPADTGIVGWRRGRDGRGTSPDAAARLTRSGARRSWDSFAVADLAPTLAGAET